MMLGESVTVTPRVPSVGTDRYGDTILTDGAEYTLTGVLVDWQATAEPAIVGRPVAVTGDLRLLVPYATPAVAASDVVRVRGRDCHVAGDPSAWHHPVTGAVMGTEIPLRYGRG